MGIVLVVLSRMVGAVATRVGERVRAKLEERRLRVRQVGAPRSKPLAGALSQVVRKARPALRTRERDSEPAPDPEPAAEVELQLQPPIPGRPGAQIWRLPAVTLFKAAPVVELSQTDVRAQAKVIEETLASFNIQAKVIEVSTGPTVTQFGLEPAPGVAVNKILARQHDLSLRLGATALRLE